MGLHRLNKEIQSAKSFKLPLILNLQQNWVKDLNLNMFYKLNFVN